MKLSKTIQFQDDTVIGMGLEGQNANSDESQIWSDFLAGSDSALSFIYRKYTPMLFNYGRQFCEEETAYDCIQDLFFYIIKKREKLRPTTAIKPYLFASLRRMIKRKSDRLRKEVKDDTLVLTGNFKISIEAWASTESSLEKEQLTNVLVTACDQLPERQREAVLLRYFEQFSFEEIGEIMDIGKIKSVRALIYRGIESLRELLLKMKDQIAFYALLYITKNLNPLGQQVV